jgi:7 transmembrane receptor (rhodopsin family)
MLRTFNMTGNSTVRVKLPARLTDALNFGSVASLYVYLELFFFVLISSGNGMVIASFFQFPALRRKLPHHWLLHLAFADLLLGLALPFHVFTFLDQVRFERYNRDTPYMCLARYATATVSIAASLVLLVLLALHVLLSVQCPYRYNAWMTPTKLHMIAFLAWIGCFSYGLLPFAGVHNYPIVWPDDDGPSCELVVVS